MKGKEIGKGDSFDKVVTVSVDEIKAVSKDFAAFRGIKIQLISHKELGVAATVDGCEEVVDGVNQVCR